MPSQASSWLFEDHGRAGVFEHRGRNARGFDDAAVGGEVAVQDRQAAGLAVGLFERMDALRILDFRRLDALAERYAGNGHAVEVQQARNLADFIEDGADAAGGVDIFDMPAAGGRDLADVGALGTDGVDPVQIVFDAGLVGDGQGVQDGIGRAAHGHIEDEGVIERFLRDNRQRLDVFADHFDDLLAGLLVQVLPPRVGRQDRAVAGQGHADRLAQAVHAVGGEHARAASLRGAAGTFQFRELLLR